MKEPVGRILRRSGIPACGLSGLPLFLSAHMVDDLIGHCGKLAEQPTLSKRISIALPALSGPLH